MPPAVVKSLVQLQPVSHHIKKNSFGNHCHAETGLVYDKEIGKFVGKQHPSGRVDQLTEEDVETCNRYRFPYLLPENLSTSSKMKSIPELDENDLIGDDEEVIDEEEEVEELEEELNDDE